jgi:hypothetical protein
VSPSADVLEYDALEVAAGDALEVEEDVVAVVRQVLEIASAQATFVRR